MIVFADERHIPTFVDCAQMENLEYDILYSSEQMRNTVDTYIVVPWKQFNCLIVNIIIA